MDGQNDARSNRSNDYRRYRSKFDSQYDSFYQSGYEEGHWGKTPAGRWTIQQRDAYDKGYEFGEDDRKRRISMLFGRYEGRYDSVDEPYVRFGYFDGYKNSQKQYDQPLSRTGTPASLPNPNRGGNRRGTTTGTATWNGRVDNRVNIILKGNEIKSQSVAGRLTGVYNNLQGVLPRNATIDVRTLDGRGSVRIVQQPNRANDGTAIVQIFDPKRGDDNYNLQITWQGSNVQEAYASGRLTWRGRVDGTVDIKISGDFVEAIDKTGSGLRIIQSNLTGYLAERNGSVRVEKRDGRGSVSVIEQATRQNDYTAVIRIFDPQGGDDEYRFDVIW